MFITQEIATVLTNQIMCYMCWLQDGEDVFYWSLSMYRDFFGCSGSLISKTKVNCKYLYTLYIVKQRVRIKSNYYVYYIKVWKAHSNTGHG